MPAAGPCRDTVSRSGRRGGVFVNGAGGSGGCCDSGSLSPESPVTAAHPGLGAGQGHPGLDRDTRSCHHPPGDRGPSQRCIGGVISPPHCEPTRGFLTWDSPPS